MDSARFETFACTHLILDESAEEHAPAIYNMYKEVMGVKKGRDGLYAYLLTLPSVTKVKSTFKGICLYPPLAPLNAPRPHSNAEGEVEKLRMQVALLQEKNSTLREQVEMQALSIQMLEEDLKDARADLEEGLEEMEGAEIWKLVSQTVFSCHPHLYQSIIMNDLQRKEGVELFRKYDFEKMDINDERRKIEEMEPTFLGLPCNETTREIIRAKYMESVEKKEEHLEERKKADVEKLIASQKERHARAMQPYREKYITPHNSYLFEYSAPILLRICRV